MSDLTIIKPTHPDLVDQEVQRRAVLQKDREIAELCLDRIHTALNQEHLTAEDLSDLAQALYSCTEVLAMIETVQAGRPLTVTW